MLWKRLSSDPEQHVDSPPPKSAVPFLPTGMKLRLYSSHCAEETGWHASLCHCDLNTKFQNHDLSISDSIFRGPKEIQEKVDTTRGVQFVMNFLKIMKSERLEHFCGCLTLLKVVSQTQPFFDGRPDEFRPI